MHERSITLSSINFHFESLLQYLRTSEGMILPVDSSNSEIITKEISSAGSSSVGLTSLFAIVLMHTNMLLQDCTRGIDRAATLDMAIRL